MTLLNIEENPSQMEEIRAASELLHDGKYRDAHERFLSLAQKGSMMARFNLGWMYHTGAGVDKDLDKAKHYYQQAADSGSPIARHYLGTLYRAKGSFNDALHWFELATKDNYLPSIYWAGSMYLLGEGAPQDVKKAEIYLRTATDKGHVYARRDLAIALIKGSFGHREITKGVFEWLASIISGMRLGAHEPQSERLM